MKHIQTNSIKNLTILTSLTLATTTATADEINISPASGRAIVVDQAVDSQTGNCDIKNQCNLRAAIAKAGAAGDRTNIRLTVDSNISAGEITIPASTNVRIFSNKERKISGNNTSKLFNIESGAKVTIDNTIIHNFQSYNAGVIVNQGTLTLTKTLIRSNKATCFGNGAMTAFATCYAGAIENRGSLILKDDTRFRGNTSEATASTASFTNANASGGAIVSSGTLIFDGNVTFRANLANAAAISGFHGSMPGGADSVSSGGAISNSGNIIITTNGEGKCRFIGNEARALASTVNGNANDLSRGGAIATKDIPGVNLAQSCHFEGNLAEVDANVAIYP